MARPAKDKDKEEVKSKKFSWTDKIKELKKKNPNLGIWYKSDVPAVECIPTGLPSIDWALKTGGLPKRRIIELYGPEASGKTSLCLQIIAHMQKLAAQEKREARIVYLDAENSLDPAWAAKLGVCVEDLVLVQGEDAHTMLNTARDLIHTGECDLLVVDSVAALVTPDELEGEMGDVRVGEQARLMSQTMKRISTDIARTPTIAIFVNQLRDKIGNAYGNPETTTGGKALRYYASVRIDVRKESNDAAYKAGHHAAKVRIAKNKVAPPLGLGTFRIDPEVGILAEYSILAPAVELGVIGHSKGSKSYTYKDKSWTYEGNAINALRDNLELQKEIVDEVYARIQQSMTATSTRTSEEDALKDIPDEEDVAQQILEDNADDS